MLNVQQNLIIAKNMHMEVTKEVREEEDGRWREWTGEEKKRGGVVEEVPGMVFTQRVSVICSECSRKDNTFYTSSKMHFGQFEEKGKQKSVASFFFVNISIMVMATLAVPISSCEN